MARNSIPRPPYTPPRSTMLIQDGILVAHIWIFNEAAMATIETQYATAQQIAARLGCSRATAYRIIKRHKKRYWLCDLRPNVTEKCISVLPIKELASAVNKMFVEKDREIRTEKLKVLVGHTPLQVLFGAGVGATVATVSILIIHFLIN